MFDEDDPSAVAAVERDLAEIAARSPALARSSYAAAALAMARDIDAPRTSATARSMSVKALNDTMDKLRELAPPQKESDAIDDLAAQREKRQRAAAGSAAPADLPLP